MGPEQFAMIGRADKHSIVRTPFGNRSTYTVERSVGFDVEPVVQVAVFLRLIAVGAFDRRGRPIGGGIRRSIRGLSSRFRGEVFIVGGRRRYVRWVMRSRSERVVWPETPKPRRRKDDVVRVDETHNE